MADIITLGELLIDLTQSGTDEKGNGIYTAYPGGAPANVAVAASRLGARTAFIGKVGDDAFGRSLEEALDKEGVDTSTLFISEDIPTTLAIASIDENGERSFSFCRSPGADTQLTEEEATTAIDCLINEPLPIDGSVDRFEQKVVSTRDIPAVLHVGSLSMTTSPSREACLEAVDFAISRGLLVSYDPNYREALWGSREQAVGQMKRLLPYTDILKVSEEEMEMLTCTSDPEEGSCILADDICIVMITLGGDGAYIRYGEHGEHIPGYRTDVADTNGAGDTFMGAMLAQIIRSIRETEGCGQDHNGHLGSLRRIGWLKLREMAVYANRAASITCSRHGAIPAMPTAAELEDSQV